MDNDRSIGEDNRDADQLTVEGEASTPEVEGFWRVYGTEAVYIGTTPVAPGAGSILPSPPAAPVRRVRHARLIGRRPVRYNLRALVPRRLDFDRREEE